MQFFKAKEDSKGTDKFFDDIVNKPGNIPSPEERDFSNLIEKLDSYKRSKSKNPKKNKASAGKPAGKPKSQVKENPQDTEDIRFPENLDDLEEEIESIPSEVAQAHEEIKTASEKIKNGNKPSFFSRIFERKDMELKKYPEPDYIMPRVIKDDVSDVLERINKARQSLFKLDLESAKKEYIKIISIYNSLNPQDRAKVYNEINDFYFERKSAEK